MKVEQRPITSIQPYGKNAKKHPEKQINQIADSIREFGFNQPIVVDMNGVIIVGHGRYFAANLLGLETVPVLPIEIDEEKAKAYRLADNKLNESEWDMELVTMVIDGTKPAPLVEQMAMIPCNFFEFTFTELSQWLRDLPELPRYIGMSWDQEIWLRKLLGPKFMTYPTVTFNGIPVIIYD